MNVWWILAWTVISPIIIWLTWELWDVWTEPTPPRCDCGLRIVRDGPVLDYIDLHVHDTGICQPQRETIK